MTASSIVGSLRASARRRQALSLVALWLPWIFAACAATWRAVGAGAAAAVLVTGIIALAVLMTRAAQRLDAAWVARQLDARRPDLEDSAGLLLAAPGSAGSLQRLQRTRIERRLADSPPPDLRAAWPGRSLALSWTFGAAITVAALLTVSQHRTAAPDRPLARPTDPSKAGSPQLVERQLEIVPPAYTGLPARIENALDARLPAGSRLSWRLRFEPQPRTVQLIFHDQSQVTLVAADGEWTAQRTLDRSAWYRIVLDGEAAARGKSRHRLEVIADQPPSVRVVAPAQNVTLHEAGQQRWSLQFEASDDYGLGAARLHVTLAQGGGENVTVTERVLQMRGEGDRRQRRYSHRLDLAPLGLAAGDDVIVRMSVLDTRSPAPNEARSASVILRWPPGSGEEPTGMEGMVRKTLPAYFRSQRQVIIDTEALVAERARLAAGRFASRSDEIGLDQRLLRLRYGQFLGEEAEDVGDAADHEHEAETADAQGDSPTEVLEQFGHTHDIPEAATLLDRETRELLRAALNEMWQAELHLRQGQPARALLYEYRALERIKQVQQATRIYLARVGLELPPIDENRRLAGDASGVRNRGDALVASSNDDALVTEWWQKLGESSPSRDGMTAKLSVSDLGSLAGWIRAREAQLPQAMEMLVAIDALNDEPQCDACRQQLRALLWTLLPQPATAPGSRPTAGPSGTTYLDALQSEARP